MIKTFILSRQEPTQPFTGEEAVNNWLAKNPNYGLVSMVAMNVWQIVLAFQLQEPPVIEMQAEKF